MKASLLKILTLSLLVSGSVLVWSAPSTAGTPPCGATAVCFYDNGGFGGSELSITATGTGWVNVGSPWEGGMSSWINNKNVDAKWAEGDNGSGNTHCMQANSSNSQLNMMNNDTMDSYRIFTTSTAC